MKNIWELFCQPGRLKGIEKMQTIANNSYLSNDYANGTESAISKDNRILEAYKSSISI
jgi:hypothetical protein